MGRMMDNEQAVLEGLTRELGADTLVVMVDLAQLSFVQQLELVARTDLLVGLHGAGLAHGLFMPPTSGAFVIGLLRTIDFLT